MKIKTLRIFIYILLSSTSLFAQDTLIVMTYNVLNFPGSTPDRVSSFAFILDQFRPDILVTSEMQTEAGMNLFLEEALNHSTEEYSAGNFINGTDTDNSVFYKHEKVNFVDNLSISTSLRLINGYRFTINNHADTTFQFQVFSAHLKASQGTTNEDRRLAEVGDFNRRILAGRVDSSYIFACDCNFYTSTESGYQYLLESMAIDLEDPINSPGSWHNNSSFASIHTQSPRTTQFGGGAHGGLDDRFDFILLSQKFFNEEDLWYVDGSYTSIGNDGSHFNLAINDGVNNSVPPGIPDALHAASDHLPVILKLAYPTETEVGLKDDGRIPRRYSLEHNYPNPWNAGTTISYSLPMQSNISLVIYNLQGQEVMRWDENNIAMGNFEKTWNGTNKFGVPVGSGVYLYRLVAGDFVQTKKMVLLK